MEFTRLFEPGMIGKMEVKNRLIMAPMGTRLADSTGHVTKQMSDDYVERAKGGA